MHSSTQQTPFFANHNFHPKFDIQGVHKVMNLAIKNQTMWLVDVQAQLISNFEKTQRRYKEECLWTSNGTTQFQSRKPSLVSTTTYQNNKTIREVRSSKDKSISHCETNHCHGFRTKASRFYENSSCISCFLVGTLPFICHFKKNPWSPSTYWSR